MRTLPSVILVAAGCAAAFAGPAQAQSCNKAAFGLSASSYMDSQLNPPPGEDVEFFSSSGGVPTIFFLIDNSVSMRRLPPNGPGFYVNPLPPLNDIQCPNGGDSYDPGCAKKNVPGGDTKKALPDVVGCGTDPISGAYNGAGWALKDILERRFATSCGKTRTSTANNGPYSSTYNYAYQAGECPHYANPDPVNHDDGFDPDFYCSGGGTSCSSHPNFFDRTMVFHESISDGNNYPDNQTGNDACGFNGTDCQGTFDPARPPGNGWDGGHVYPFKTDSNTIGTVDDFCARYQADVTAAATAAGATTTLGGQTIGTPTSHELKDLCTQCLNSKGFFFDGYAYRQDQEGVSNVLYPSIWLTGNYLNFYPPKFIVARKALKDLLMNNLRIRSGVAAFGSDGDCRSAATMVKSLNPSCNNVYDSKSNLYSNRASFMTAINGIPFDGRGNPLSKGTPLGMALLNVGEQFRSSSLTSWFGAPINASSGQTDCKNTAASTGFEPPSSVGNGNQQGICFPCQSTNIVVITDGRPKPNSGAYADDQQVPSGSATVDQSNTLYIGNNATGVDPGPDSTACPDCSTFGTGKENLNEAIRISWLFHNFDFGDNDVNAFACNKLEKKQVLNIYTLGFGSSFSTDAQTLLTKMASVGGGIFTSADTPAQLNSAFTKIIQNIDTRATSFSVASVNALQATAGQSVIVPRFNPAKAAFWNGHLYRFELYSEFAAGCQPGSSTDLDCDCACNSVFLQDSVGDFISEDANGTFKKNVPNKPTCGPTNHCGTGSCGVASTDPAKVAVPFWDAAAELNARSWKERIVYTAIDDPSAPDGQIDASDPVIALIDPATHAFLGTTITKLQPYLGLTLAAGGNCDSLSAQLATAGDNVGAFWVGSDVAWCAKAYLAYLLGADLLNHNLNRTTSTCPYPPPSTTQDANGNYIWDPLALCDRGPPNAPGKLGDIFHSSPVRVLEPEPSSDIFSSYNSQTLSSLWITSTVNDPLSGSTNAYAYDDYAAAYNKRRRLVVVGANDGLLHAFNAGDWKDAQDDPLLLPNIKTSEAPFFGYYNKGDGAEVWAFIPPDLLPKIPLMTGNQHQFFIDGDPMVRDVWVDGGTANAGVGGTTHLDDKKQPNEFHTVVVAAERRGGTHYFALDVTDATKKSSETGYQAPRFLWIYPQPNQPQELELGETYTGFLPVPPPIGPVRLDADTAAPAATTGVTRTYVDHAGSTKNVHERWVVFLSGGFDPQYVRGHGVHMLDVWTGQELLDFSRPADGDTSVDATNPRWKLDAPVAGTVAMVAFGPRARADTAYPPNGGFFDTATFGDTNGALWTIRFNDPGHITDGKVDNWWGGRSFQFDKSDTSTFCGSNSARQPFFYITANVPLYSSNRMYRVLAGTGDRYNLLDQYGGTCGPDNIRACMLRGCSVSVPSDSNKITVDSLLGTQSTGFATSACTVSTAETMTSGTAGTQCTAIQGRAEVDISGCTSFDATSLTSTSKTFSTDCSLNASGGATCAPTTGATQAKGDQLFQSTALSYNNWFVSVRNFDDSGARAPFNDLAGAAAYDGARLTQTQNALTPLTNLKQIDGSSTSPATTTAESVGWAMYFNHNGTVTYSAKTYNVAKADERTASPSSTPGDGCIYWNAVQPALLDRSSQCPCTVQNTDRFSYFYGANVAGGGLCLKNGTPSGSGTSCTVSNASIRSVGGLTLTTPPAPQPTWFVNSSGQVSVGMTSIQVGSGAQNIGTGLINDAVRQVDWLPMTRSNEACRHAGTTAPPASACQQ